MHLLQFEKHNNLLCWKTKELKKTIYLKIAIFMKHSERNDNDANCKIKKSLFNNI